MLRLSFLSFWPIHFIYFCRIMRKYVKLLLCLCLANQLFAQDKWDLRQCVDYALKNNITVRQTDLQSRFSALALKQSKASALPSSTSAAVRVIVLVFPITLLPVSWKIVVFLMWALSFSRRLHCLIGFTVKTLLLLIN